MLPQNVAGFGDFGLAEKKKLNHENSFENRFLIGIMTG
jgi:hypothetical protein